MVHEIRFSIRFDTSAARVLLATAVMLVPLGLGSENLTLVTSYPAPAGVYNSIVTVGNGGENTILARTDGAVGVGISNPGNGFNTKLDVVGRASFRSMVGNANTAIKVDSIGGALRIYSDAISGTPADLILGTYPNGHFNQIYLKQSNGWVGIGTSNPAAPFDVAGKIRVNAGPPTGGALCLNANREISKCASEPDASGNCACP